MKVLIICSSFERSGPINQLLNTVKYLTSKEMIDFHIVTLKTETKNSMSQDFKSLGIKIFSLQFSSFVEKIKSLKELNQKESYEWVQSCGIIPDLISSITFRKKTITTLRNYPLEDYPLQYGYVKGHLMARVHYFILKFIKTRVCVSEASASKNRIKSGLAFSLILNGVDTDNFQPEFDLKEKILSSINLSSDRVTFIFTGPLIERKNVAEIIRYINNSKFQLLILGDGPLKKELKSLVLTPNIKFIGNVNNVSDYLSIADYFIMGSVSEGFPNSVLEALSCGLPCVLSGIEPHKEVKSIIRDDIYIYNNPLELESLLREHDFNILTKNKRINIRKKTIKNLSCKETAQKYFELYTTNS
ncbi:MAG: glycosyltransferase involved in cell wall biosynthesis [Mariniflexile sp.]|jgi:glycosyltransferase involved in cell wall biosynthesis